VPVTSVDEIDGDGDGDGDGDDELEDILLRQMRTTARPLPGLIIVVVIIMHTYMHRGKNASITPVLAYD